MLQLKEVICLFCAAQNVPLSGARSSGLSDAGDNKHKHACVCKTHWFVLATRGPYRSGEPSAALCSSELLNQERCHPGFPAKVQNLLVFLLDRFNMEQIPRI